MNSNSNMETTNNYVKYEVLVKQNLPAFLDISDECRMHIFLLYSFVG